MTNSVETAPTVVTTGERRLTYGLPQCQGVALLLLLGWLYPSILARLFLQWVGPTRDPNFEHGDFFPLFAMLILWEARQSVMSIRANPSWAGRPGLRFALPMSVR